MSIADADKFDAVIGRIGIRMSYPRKAMIYCEKDSAERVYKLLSGSVFTCKNLSDGRRQIVGLYLPGDFFGLEPGDEYSLSAEVVGNAKVLVVKKKALAELANRDAAIQSTISFLLAREVERMRDRVLLLLKNAQERVVEFLLHMEKRTPAKNLIELPLLRQDIADYLGLTIETVSRIITFLESRAAIGRATRRSILLHSRSLLKNPPSEGHPQQRRSHRQSGSRRQQTRTTRRILQLSATRA
jgi:CRP/FNR family transcriptional regulator, nitrogen fixation regulation protein